MYSEKLETPHTFKSNKNKTNLYLNMALGCASMHCNLTHRRELEHNLCHVIPSTAAACIGRHRPLQLQRGVPRHRCCRDRKAQPLRHCWRRHQRMHNNAVGSQLRNWRWRAAQPCVVVCKIYVFGNVYNDDSVLPTFYHGRIPHRQRRIVERSYGRLPLPLMHMRVNVSTSQGIQGIHARQQECWCK